MDTPLILLALSLPAGILAGTSCRYFPGTTALFLLLAAALLVVAVMYGHLPRRRAAFLCSGVAAGMLLLIAAESSKAPDHFTRLTALDGAVHDLSGRISSPLDREETRTAFLMDAARIDGTPASGKIRVILRSSSPSLGYGDRISLRGKLSPPRGYRNPGGFDYPAFLRRQGIEGVLSVRRDADITVEARGSGILRTVQDLRERIRQAMTSATKGDGSAVLQAMVLGEEGGLTDELRDRFMTAGVTHILSISGSHLGMVAILCYWMVRRLLFLLPERIYHRLTLSLDPRKLAALAVIAPVTFYAFLAGGQVATLRSLIMILAGLAAVLLDREGDAGAVLALAALIILVPDPRALFDISFQLSYLSVFSIVFVVRSWQLLVPRSRSRFGNFAAQAGLLLVVSLATTVSTGPLVVHYFNRLSFAGIAANMVVVPFAGVIVVPLGLLSGVLSLATGSLPLAPLNQSAADSFVALVSFFARIPAASVDLPAPGWTATIAGLIAILSFGLILNHRLMRRYQPLEFTGPSPRAPVLLLLCSTALLASFGLLSLFRPAADRITFLDVGQGDCALVETASGRRVLIDGGGVRENRFDVGNRVVAPFLLNRGIRTVDLVVLSHPHPDHLYGLFAVLRRLRVRELWTSGLDAGLDGYAELMTEARSQGIPVRIVQAGDETLLNGLQITVLHPASGFPAGSGKAYARENNRSLVLALRTGTRTFLFPGDVQVEGERALVAAGRLSACDLLKVPHHGSRTSSTPELLAAVRPAIAVICAGAGNPYRHPTKTVLDRLAGAGCGIYRTDTGGAIIVTGGKAVLTATRWTDLLLLPTYAAGNMTWFERERENWRRLWIRGWAI
ncbi:MAG: DNA internalization-related competence protein ComEC/Rec2 [Nitrospiraceae bacterium]|nr:DNA internalization-related competence protein ComEC/Rec2 [Nitrospiraceae bacterium]